LYDWNFFNKKSGLEYSNPLSKGCIKIENIVAVTKDGNEVLNKASKEIMIL
jgi:hypothetical protein